MVLLPIAKMLERIDIDRDESDTSLFFSLMYYGELLLKLMVSGMVAAVTDDRDRHRYRQLHRLVRTDGLGDWVAVLDEVLIGPSAQYLVPAAREEQRELTQKMPADSWEHEANHRLIQCLAKLKIEREPLPMKVAAKGWASLFVQLRNKTRAHGAPKGGVCSDICRDLEGSLELLATNFSLFMRPWAYLRRNLSGKYRITLLGGDADPFVHLKRSPNFNYPNGVYISFNELTLVDLVESDPDASDFFFPNGGFTDKRYELLSYTSGDTIHEDSGPYLAPPEQLPKSQTEGIGQLELQGHCFANLPPKEDGYITRKSLESELREQLQIEHHPLVSLTGPGGIGKTSLALKVLHELVEVEDPRYEVIIWFSARDIDLLPHGAQLVRPHLLAFEDFGKEYARLVDPAQLADSGFKATEYLTEALSSSPLGPILFVVDNFETLTNPVDIFARIETFVRPPNKVLITTRIRQFRGDFPVEVSGMTEDESNALIDQTAKQLRILSLISTEYRQEVFRESDGHPYVIKVLLGEVAKAKRAQKVERIVAAREDILRALFERTYANLSPASQRIFLTLCNWRSTIPEVALKAVVLRPQNERIEVDNALQELVQSSFVEEVRSEQDQHVFLSVPLAASIFGKRKLVVSPWKAAVEADTTFLLAFGAAQKADVRHGIRPRIQRLFATIAQQIATGKQRIVEVQGMLEFIARRYPPAWLLLADLYDELGGQENRDGEKEALRHYLEQPSDSESVSRVWKRLADVCRDTDDPLGEIHALVAQCEQPSMPTYAICNAANRINSALCHSPARVLDSQEKKLLVQRVVVVMQGRLADLNATDCSRLAWLYRHLGQDDRGVELAKKGLALDSNNEHCERFLAHSSVP